MTKQLTRTGRLSIHAIKPVCPGNKTQGMYRRESLPVKQPFVHIIPRATTMAANNDDNGPWFLYQGIALHTLVGTEEEDDDSETSAEHGQLKEQLDLLESTNDYNGASFLPGAFTAARSRTEGEEEDDTEMSVERDELEEQLELRAAANDNAGLSFASTPTTAPSEAFTATRSNAPLTDFSTDDFVISCCFPTVFMFGRVYHRSTGTFSFDQKNHLLKQYTAIPAKNRRLLFYLFDTIKRYKSICGVNAYVKRDRRSVEALGALIGDAAERSTIKRARFSLAYINNIRPNITVDCLFSGFHNDGSKPWTEVEWAESVAYANSYIMAVHSAPNATGLFLTILARCSSAKSLLGTSISPDDARQEAVRDCMKAGEPEEWSVLTS